MAFCCILHCFVRTIVWRKFEPKIAPVEKMTNIRYVLCIMPLSLRAFIPHSLCPTLEPNMVPSIPRTRSRTRPTALETPYKPNMILSQKAAKCSLCFSIPHSFIASSRFLGYAFLLSHSFPSPSK